MLPLAVVLLAVGVKLVTMSWFSTRGVSAYDDARYDQSAAAFDRLQVLNVVDPWRAHLGSGAALYRRDDLDGAEAAFRRALDLAPERCDVRFNLVVTIEAQGDRLVGGDAGAVEESALQDGRSRYAIALDIAKGRLCPPSTAGDAGVRLEEARRRLQDKLGPRVVGAGGGAERAGATGGRQTGGRAGRTRRSSRSPSATRRAPPNARTSRPRPEFGAGGGRVQLVTLRLKAELW